MDNLLEHNILNHATELLEHLESQVNDESGEVEETDINKTADYLFSLIDLREADNHGMSNELDRNLAQINVRALHLLRNR